MTREELVKQGLILPVEAVTKLAHGYASRIPYPKNESEFKELIAKAYLEGAELITDFYFRAK